MLLIPLSTRIRVKLGRLFSPDEARAAEALLESQCGSGLPLVSAQGLEGIERIRCGVLKISDGSLERLRAAVKLANTDWRDVLVGAGFADSVHAHESWLEDGFDH